MRPGELMPAYEGGPQVSPTARFARALLACALRFWPAESRAWGAALAAEVDEATNDFDAMRWSLGGLMFFARSVLSSTWTWLKLPAGSSLPGSAAGGAGGPLMPKRSRLFTAALLAVASVLLLLPEGRDAMRTVRASWMGWIPRNTDQRTLDEMAAHAENEKDAQTLAFVALSPLPGAPRGSTARTEQLVEQTVALDPSFIWIYVAKNHRRDYYPTQKEWVARLQAADPQNAVPILLEASALAEEKLSTPGNRGFPSEKEFATLADDPEWVMVMQRAFAAPTYDNYLQKHVRLMQTIWNRDPNLPPEIFLVGLWSHAIPDMRVLRAYAQMQLNAADVAAASGDAKHAEALAQGVLDFGKLVSAASGTSIEKLSAIGIVRMADKELAKTYTIEGKTEEARKAIEETNQLEKFVRSNFAQDEPGRLARIQAFRREAALVQGAVILGGLSLFCAIVGILALELWPRGSTRRIGLINRTLCIAADWAPLAVLLATGAFLVSFLPFQRVLADFRVSAFQLADEQKLTDAIWSLIAVPEHLIGVDAAVAFWSMLTITLSAAVVTIVAFGIYRARRVASRA